ncbi:hypothetical protein, partial [Salmonella enterica]|uniref:hypothetical protein n=1 Tax=Salmonella enterica TaxID=28901 RepID=UPI003523AA81
STTTTTTTTTTPTTIIVQLLLLLLLLLILRKEKKKKEVKVDHTKKNREGRGRAERKGDTGIATGAFSRLSNSWAIVMPLHCTECVKLSVRSNCRHYQRWLTVLAVWTISMREAVTPTPV